MPKKKTKEKKVVKIQPVVEPKKEVKKPVAVKPKPVVGHASKKLPYVDNCQVSKVREDGHTDTHLLCDATTSCGDLVVMYVDKKLF